MRNPYRIEPEEAADLRFHGVMSEHSGRGPGWLVGALLAIWIIPGAFIGVMAAVEAAGSMPHGCETVECAAEGGL